MGAAAIRQLLSLAEPETTSSAKSENQPQELLPPGLIVRDSTAIAAKP
jgi:DNA-binding LacI/PurR family transcriptional regulator